MSALKEQSNVIFGVFEPHVTATFLPRCPECSHKHPLAYNPPLTDLSCPGCGKPRPEAGTTIDVPAVVTDRRLSIGALLIRFGKFLQRLSEGL